jgi:hypothetical protein
MMDPKQAALNKQYQDQFAQMPWWKKLPTAGMDLTRTLQDDVTFGLADQWMSKLTGRDETAITKAVRSRMGHADIPGAFGVGMATPSGVPNLVARIGGGSAMRHITGLLGGAAEGAVQGAASAIGHGEDVKQGAAFGAAAAPAAHAIIGPLSAATNKAAKWWKGADDTLPPPHIGNVKGYEDHKIPPGHTDDFYQSRDFWENEALMKPGDPRLHTPKEVEAMPKFWEPPEFTTVTPKSQIEDAAWTAEQFGGKPVHYLESFDDAANFLKRTGDWEKATPYERNLFENIFIPEAGDLIPHAAADALSYSMHPIKQNLGIPLDTKIMPSIDKLTNNMVEQSLMEKVAEARRYATDIPAFQGPISPIMQGRASKGMRRGLLSAQENEENF